MLWTNEKCPSQVPRAHKMFNLQWFKTNNFEKLEPANVWHFWLTRLIDYPSCRWLIFCHLTNWFIDKLFQLYIIHRVCKDRHDLGLTVYSHYEPARVIDTFFFTASLVIILSSSSALRYKSEVTPRSKSPQISLIDIKTDSEKDDVARVLCDFTTQIRFIITDISMKLLLLLFTLVKDNLKKIFVVPQSVRLIAAGHPAAYKIICMLLYTGCLTALTLTSPLGHLLPHQTSLQASWFAVSSVNTCF